MSYIHNVAAGWFGRVGLVAAAHRLLVFFAHGGVLILSMKPPSPTLCHLVCV